MFLGAPGRCLFCKFSQKNEKVSIKSQASTCNPDILAVCFLAGQSTFHHCEAKETDRNCQRGNISWNYILSMCSLYCFTSWNEFLWMADPNKCLKATCKGSHTASLARANPACDKKHRLGSTNSPPKWFEIDWDEPLLILHAWMSQQKLCRLYQLTLKDGTNCSWSEPGTYLSRRVALHTSAEFGHALHRSLCLDPLRRREPLQKGTQNEVVRRKVRTIQNEQPPTLTPKKPLNPLSNPFNKGVFCVLLHCGLVCKPTLCCLQRELVLLQGIARSDETCLSWWANRWSKHDRKCWVMAMGHMI